MSRASKPKDAPPASYEREDGTVMIEIEPGWFVAKETWAKLQRAGVDRCTKANEE